MLYYILIENACAGENMSGYEDLKKQLNFLIETDKMKSIIRRSYLIDASRRENDAEHSWSLAMYVLVLSEYANEKIDVDRAVRMAIAHDLIEVYAGDTYAYDEKANEDKEEREQLSADKLFSILPEKQGMEFRQLWNEFEEKKTPEALFVNSVDKLQPLMHNYLTEGISWKEGKVKKHQVEDKMSIIKHGAPKLYKVVEFILEDAVKRGLLEE